jgi:hypothetical protein
MTLPVVERIANEIVTRLETKFLKVVRPERTGKNVSPEDGKIIVDQQASVENPSLHHAGNPMAVAYDVNFSVYCYVRESTVDSQFPISYASACNAVAAEVISAITTPATSPATWYLFGGDAINARVGQHTPVVNAAGNSIGINVPIYVTYRVSENDHTQARA